MKKYMVIVLVFLCVLFDVGLCATQSELANEIYKNSNIDSIADSNEKIEIAMPDFSFSDVVDNIVSGKNIFDFPSVLSTFLKLFSVELYRNIKIMMTVVLLAVISGIVNNIQSAYNSKTIAQTAFFAFFTVFMGLVAKGLSECFQIASETVSDQVLFMKTAVPVYMALVTSTGNPAAAIGMEPVFLYFIQLIGTLLEKIILPLIFWISVLNMVNCLTERFSITKLIEFTKQLIRWGMGILMTFFISILGMSGVTATITNNLGIKTMKYAVGNFVPVVGGLLSDSIDTVLASASVLKGAMGTAGVIAIALMCAVPLIKMLTFVFIYKLTAGLVEPLADKRITTMISEAGSTASFAFTILLAVAVMFILGITITVSVSGKLY